MENNEEIKPQEIPAPAHIFKSMQLFRFGKIFTNMSITSCILVAVMCLIAVAMPFVQVFGIIFLFIAIVAMVIFTLGAVFAFPSAPISKAWNLLTGLVNSTETLLKVAQVCISAIPYLCIIGMSVSGLAIVMLSITKQKGRVSRIVTTSILAFVMAISLVLFFILGGTL